MNVPKLRFKEFDDSYILDTYDNVINIIDGDRGNNYPKESDFYDDEYCLFLNAGNVTKNGFNFSNKSFITLKKDNELRNGKLRRNDVVLTTRGTVGNVALYDDSISFENIRINSGMVINRIKSNKLLPQYLYQFMQSSIFDFQVKKANFGSAQPQLTKKGIAKFNIAYPSIKEQRKVYNFLSLLDKKIQLQTKKIEALKLFKLSITQNIFNEKKLNDFQSVTLEKILKPGSKIPVKNTSEYEKMTVKLNFKGLAKLEIKKEMADTRPFYVRNENEIIIGKQNYFNGSIAKVTKDFKGCICSNAIMSFTTINGVNVDYVLYYLSQKNYINRRKFLANGTGQKELSEKEFLKFVIKLPSTQIQNNISKKISCVSNLLLLENKKLTILNNLKKGLLQNLFV